MACLLALVLGMDTADEAFTVADTTDVVTTVVVDTGADIMDDLDLAIGRVMVIETAALAGFRAAADTVAGSDAAVAADSAAAIVAAFMVAEDSTAAVVVAFTVAEDSTAAVVVEDSMAAVAADLTVADMAAAIGN
jgi:uncharacterized protein (DUF2126 family)